MRPPRTSAIRRSVVFEPKSNAATRTSAFQLFQKKFVHHFRIRLALRSLHHLADEKSEKLLLSSAIVRYSGLVLRHHIVDDFFDGRIVRNLAHAFRLYDVSRRLF